MRNRRAAFSLIGIAAVATAAHAEERAPFRRPPVQVPYSQQLSPLQPPLPYPQDFSITRRLDVPPDAQARNKPDAKSINLPSEIPSKLSACWAPPPVDENQIMQVTVRLAFRTDGTVIGTPLTPYLNAPTDDLKAALRASIVAAIRACTPLQFTPSLSKAIAGRIFAIRFVVHHVSYDQRT